MFGRSQNSLSLLSRSGEGVKQPVQLCVKQTFHFEVRPSQIIERIFVWECVDEIYRQAYIRMALANFDDDFHAEHSRDFSFKNRFAPQC